MSEISPELKALIFTLAAHRFALRHQREQVITTASIQHPTTSTGPCDRPLIPLSMSYYDNLLITYSLQSTLSTPTNNGSLSTISEETAEDDKTPKNKSLELSK